MVDCGVYADGRRLPGKYTHAAALNKVRELQKEGTEAFVWIGLHEPDEHQMQAVADVFGLHELAVEDAVSSAPSRAVEFARCFVASSLGMPWVCPWGDAP